MRSVGKNSILYFWNTIPDILTYGFEVVYHNFTKILPLGNWPSKLVLKTITILLDQARGTGQSCWTEQNLQFIISERQKCKNNRSPW